MLGGMPVCGKVSSLACVTMVEIYYGGGQKEKVKRAAVRAGEAPQILPLTGSSGCVSIQGSVGINRSLWNCLAGNMDVLLQLGPICVQL